jgi:hypothetical protein
MDADPDPSVFIIDLQMPKKTTLKKFFGILLFDGTFA